MPLPILVALMFSLVAPGLAAPGSPTTTPVQAGLEPPSVTAQGVYSYDLATGIVLYEQNADERMQIGSTVKVATALVAVANADTSEEVLTRDTDTVDITIYSNMGLVSGDTLTLGTLLYGLLLPSGNDAAHAIARHVGYTLCDCDNDNAAIDAFVQAMNDYAANLGLQNTWFTRPDGLDAAGAYSSAHDIAILFGELMKDDYLAGIVAEPAYSFDSIGSPPNHYERGTTNLMLGQMGVIGGKTGTTEAAGACVVLARSMNGGSSTIITSILGSDVAYDENSIIVEGSDKRWDDARAIFTAMDEQYAWIVPGTEGTFPGLSEEMAVWQVGFNGDPVVPYPREGVETGYQLVLDSADSGTVDLFYDQQLAGSLPVQVTSASTGPDGQDA
jgi:D-alanyl-D-alanine carboxypeptidase